jgi:predicted dehydrogenase
MSSKVRCAVIGAGAIGLAHMDGFKKHPDAELAVVAETIEKRLQEALAKHKGARGISDWRALLKDKTIDAISVALPNYLHEEVTCACLKAGKHVMLDKPMTTNAKEAAKIMKAWKEKKVVFMVGQNFRFNRETQTIKAAITRGELGEVYHGRAHWLRRSGIPRIGSWFTQKKYAGGGCCYDIGVHFLDCTLHLMGTFEAEAVSGQVSTKFGHRGLGDGSWGMGEIDPKKPFDVEDLAVAMIKLKGGKTVLLEISWALHAESGRDNGIDLYGTEAGASLYPARIHKVRPEGIVTVTPTAPAKLPVPEDRMVHFVDCIVKRTPPLVKPQESFMVQKILDGIYESSRTGKEVRIK